MVGLRCARALTQPAPLICSYNYNGSRLLVLLFLGVFFGLLYLDTDLATAQAFNKVQGIILGSIGFAGIISFTSSLPLHGANRAALYRERAAGRVATIPYALALAVTEIPCVVQPPPSNFFGPSPGLPVR